MKVIIYSLVDVFYYSFYIEGFYGLYGKKNVISSCKEFPNFPERTFAAIVKGDKTCKIAIDAFDTSKINTRLLEWADVYGKVNKNEENLPQNDQGKILAIGPSFGIKIWSPLETVKYSFINWFISRKRAKLRRDFFASYWRQHKRVNINKYNTLSNNRDNFIFFISSLWEKEKKTNSDRFLFMGACKELPSVQFEGGFAPRDDIKKMGYEKVVSERINLQEYINKISDSFVVFNTPAVQNCHGWKLGEYLALGKAIISTQPANLLPEPLIHGEHLHYVLENKEEMKMAITKILKEPEYRKKLEENARDYYSNNLAPEIVVKKLIENCG